MWQPTTTSLSAATTSFINVRMALPLIVLRMGRKLLVYTSTLPYLATACSSVSPCEREGHDTRHSTDGHQHCALRADHPQTELQPQHNAGSNALAAVNVEGDYQACTHASIAAQKLNPNSSECPLCPATWFPGAAQYTGRSCTACACPTMPVHVICHIPAPLRCANPPLLLCWGC
jgi:hypothetical protein